MKKLSEQEYNVFNQFIEITTDIAELYAILIKLELDEKKGHYRI